MGKSLKGKELGKGITQRKDGIYCGRFTNRFGKRENIYDAKLSVLRQKLNEAIYEDQNGMNTVSNDMTLNEWFEQWIKSYKLNSVRKTTLNRYMSIYNIHIRSNIGNCKLKDINQIQVQSLINELENKQLKSTPEQVKILLIGIFNKAVENEFIQRNPARGVEITKNRDKHIRVLSLKEQIEFFKFCEGHYYYNAFTVQVNTGLRFGELAALRECDLDFENRLIHVTSALIYFADPNKKNRWHIGPPKTESSKRSIPMNKKCERALQEQIKQNRIKKIDKGHCEDEPDEFIFTAKRKDYLFPSSYNGALLKIVTKYNQTHDFYIEPFTNHALRHTFATRCFEANIPFKTVQAYLGHSSFMMTMDIYTHITKEQKISDISKLDDLFEQIESSGVKLV